MKGAGDVGYDLTYICPKHSSGLYWAQRELCCSSPSNHCAVDWPWAGRRRNSVTSPEHFRPGSLV